MWVSRINAVSGCEFQELWQSANSLKRHVLLSGWHYATPWYEQLRIHQSPGRSQNSSPPPHLAVGWQDLNLLPTRLPNSQHFQHGGVFEKSFIFLSFLRTRFNSPLASCTNQRPAWLSNSCKTPRLDDRTTSFGKETCFQPSRAPVYFPMFRQDPTFSSYSIFTTPSHQTANQPYVPWDWIIYLHLA